LGEHGHRRITFSHFREEKDAEPTLETFSWDERETHFYYLERLHMDRLQWPAKPSDVEGWRRQWAGAFTSGHREPIRTAKQLSEELASLAVRTRDLVLEVLKYERSDGPLHRLFESFQKVLIHDLTEHGFSDMVAQTVAYGLFSARCTGQALLGLAHLEAMVPNTNRFLKELFAELANISGHKKGQINFDDLGLSEMVDLLRNTNIEAVLEDFGRQTGGGKEDPVVHFYETFLHVYDNEQKIQRGVFYTPKPVVSFIVQSVHEMIQKEFGLPDGLADTTTWREMADKHAQLQIPAGVKTDAPFVQILDPATGTGTFLEEVIDVVHKTMTSKWRREGKTAAQQHESWNEYVPKHLLPRVHGFELMMAPYSVAHMKLGLKLRQTGYDFTSNQQLRVYLTNTLEPPEKGTRKLGFLPDFLSHESVQADVVKEKKAITVIVGNPPYSNFGQLNRNDWILSLLTSYKEGLNERKLNLDDDFIKFIRASQYFLARVPIGIVGFITNNTYLDGITHRQMRSSLRAEFTRLTFYDLHGSVKRKEVAPDGTPDENVFDIQQGVAISVFLRDVRSDRVGVVARGDLWGSRSSKYTVLQSGSLASTELSELAPVAPFYFFTRTHATTKRTDRYVSLPSLFEAYSSGVQTKRDSVVVAFTPNELRRTVEDFAKLPTSIIRDNYGLPADGRDWAVEWAKEHCRSLLRKGFEPKAILYRPFDVRWTVIDDKSKGFVAYPRFELMRHFFHENLGLVAVRQISTGTFNHAFVTRHPISENTISTQTREYNYVFPLYCYGDQPPAVRPGVRTQPSLFARKPNVRPEAVQLFERALSVRFVDGKPGRSADCRPWESLFTYVYGLLHSTVYREQFSEALLHDFAGIPYAIPLDVFDEVAELGADLVRLHSLDFTGASFRLNKGPGAVVVERGFPEYSGGVLRLSGETFIKNIPEPLWSKRIGAFQVAKKWLVDRSGRKLTEDELSRYLLILEALSRMPDIVSAMDAALSRAVDQW
jgi:hypothetical protein